MKRISFIVAAFAAVAMISCQKEVKEDLTSYYKTFSDNSEIIGFAEESSQTFSVYAKTTDAGCDIPVKVTFGVDESLVDQYNASKDEGEKALLLPSSIYRFENNPAEIRAMYRISSKANIVITHDADILQEETWYVLPVVITEVSGSADAHIADDNVKFLTVKTARAGAGSGTKEKPYLMRTAEDLVSLATLVIPVEAADAEPTYVKLWNDIDLTGVEWKPVNYTTGTQKIDFDGNGKTISNLTCAGDGASFLGCMFGSIHDVTFENAHIEANGNGGVVAAQCGIGSGKLAGYITNVRVKNSYVIGKTTGVGGIVGQMNVGQISRCSYDGTVSGTNNYVGGIVGYLNKGDNYDGAKVDNCFTSGQVIEDGTGHQRYGGIAGGINGQHQFVEFCISTCEVVSGTGTAGIVGMAHYDSSSASACLGHDNTVKCCIAWNPRIYARKIQTKNYSPGAIIGFASEDGNYINCVRRPDMEFVQNIEQEDTEKYPVNWWKLCDQENSSAASPLSTGINCDHSTVYNSPYNGKAAAEGETASAVAKRLGWDQNIWDLSGAIPALK